MYFFTVERAPILLHIGKDFDSCNDELDVVLRLESNNFLSSKLVRCNKLLSAVKLVVLLFCVFKVDSLLTNSLAADIFCKKIIKSILIQKINFIVKKIF